MPHTPLGSLLRTPIPLSVKVFHASKGRGRDRTTLVCHETMDISGNSLYIIFYAAVLN